MKLLNETPMTPSTTEEFLKSQGFRRIFESDDKKVYYKMNYETVVGNKRYYEDLTVCTLKDGTDPYIIMYAGLYDDDKSMGIMTASKATDTLEFSNKFFRAAAPVFGAKYDDQDNVRL